MARGARRPGRFARSAVALVLLATVSAACQTAPLSLPPPSFVPADAVPAFGHVWVVVMENTNHDAIVGSPDAPYLNELISQGGLAEAYTGVTRPSQPNYLALFSGSTHGVADNESHDIDAPTLADQLDAVGRTWGEYVENVPPDCFTGATASGGRDGPGDYVRKHAPAISFTSIRSDPARCANIQDLTAFEPGAVDYALIIPNLCHDMHDCSIAEGDAWMADFVPRITTSDLFSPDGVLIVTFDEDDPDAGGDGRVATFLVSPLVRAGTRSDIPHNHYSLLRTVQESWGLDCLAYSCGARTLAEFFDGS